MKFTASWEIMSGLQMGILLDDGLNVAVYIGSITLDLYRGDLRTPVGVGVGFSMGGTVFGVLARVLRRCVRSFALRVLGAVGLVDVVMVGDRFTL